MKYYKIVILFSFICKFNFTFGCLCAPTLFSSFESSDVVFIGKVDTVFHNSFATTIGITDYTNFIVYKSFKGCEEFQNYLSVFGDNGDCDYKFVKDKLYLVFSKKNGVFLSTHGCLSNESISNINEYDTIFKVDHVFDVNSEDLVISRARVRSNSKEYLKNISPKVYKKYFSNNKHTIESDLSKSKSVVMFIISMILFFSLFIFFAKKKF
ncbi:MAG: hypothetical protein IT271_13890 [Chitinophagales bacterium]|nr:hypothetical protein [Chitinophagales bacterium]